MALTQVSTDGVKNDAISHNKIPANAIQASELADNAVDTAAIADSAVTGPKIADGTIGAVKLGSNVVTTAKIADDAVTDAKLATGSVGTAALADTAVTTAKIADSNVTTAKLANDAVTGAKIADDAIDSEHYTDGSIDTAHIANSAISNNKLQDNSIVSGKLADSGVNSGSYGSATAIPAITVNNKGQITAASTNNVNIPAGTTISGNANNRIITGSDTANTLNADADVTYDSATSDFSILGAKPGTSMDLIVQNNGGGNAAGARITIQSGNASNTGPQFGMICNSKTWYLQTPKNVGALDFHGNGTRTFRLLEDGHVEISNGHLTLGSNGRGIDFYGGSGSYRQDANILDDYEEGTYTPVVTGDSGTATTSSANGVYTKIGRFVNVNLQFSLSSRNGISGSVYVSLPFTVGDRLAGTSLESNGVCVYFHGLTASSFLGVNTINGNAHARFGGVETKQVTDSTTIASGDIQDSFGVRCTVSYFT